MKKLEVGQRFKYTTVEQEIVKISPKGFILDVKHRDGKVYKYRWHENTGYYWQVNTCCTRLGTCVES